MADRFQFEQELMQLDQTGDDIDLVVENILERDIDADDIANALIGVAALFRMRFQKVFDTFEALVHSGDIKAPNPDTDYDENE